jgi:hypothetical protein
MLKITNETHGRTRRAEEQYFFYLGSLLMSDRYAFQIVCIDCGCLSIRIEDPVSASRDAIVYCGDCGGSRGTLGDLRDLAVQTNTEVTLPTGSQLPSRKGLTKYDPQSDGEISERYGELQRLRRQVKMAESLAATRDNPIRVADNTRGKKILRSGRSSIPQRQSRSAGATHQAN